MMKLISLVMALLLVCSYAYAGDTGGANYTSPNGKADSFAEFLNEQDCIDHTHRIEDRDDPLGIGLDVEYDVNDKFGVAVEVKRDLENDETSAFLVGKIKLNALLERGE